MRGIKHPFPSSTCSKSGFSLVELSIVLVILGLLTGGILTGQNLIRAAELRSVATDMMQYKTATYTFRDKYFAIPGDMRNATDFWGAMTTGTCPSATGGTGTQTCNGDGDGVVDDAAAADTAGEKFTFWQHLGNAGLIPGSYNGLAGSSHNLHATADNTPQTKLSNAIWRVIGDGAVTGNGLFFDGTYMNGLYLGGPEAVNPSAVLTPQEAWNIDTKIDDGMPATGILTQFLWAYQTIPAVSAGYQCSDATTSDQFDSEYLLSSEALGCLLMLQSLH